MKWVFRRTFSCDLLVVDTIGKGWLKACLPECATTELLNIREERVFLLEVSFIVQLFISCLWQALKRDGTLGYAWLSTLLKRLTPRLIISCADNNLLLAKYAEDNPQVPVVLLQNALRDTRGSMTPGQNLPTYLALGEVEKEIFHALDIRCKKYRPIGSIKLGLALEQDAIKPRQAFDLAFISHYRPEMFGAKSSSLQQHIECCQRRLFEFCCRYVRNYNLSFCVITKTREPEARFAEQAYYTRLAKDVSLDFICADKAEKELESYLAGLSSSLIIHPGSTLGYELFAAGKKAILGGTIDPELIRAWGVEHYVDRLPDSIKLKAGCSYADFFLHCETLRAMPDTQYCDITREAAQSLVSMPTNGHPHETIKSLISEYLNR